MSYFDWWTYEEIFNKSNKIGIEFKTFECGKIFNKLSKIGIKFKTFECDQYMEKYLINQTRLELQIQIISYESAN
jgi:hypothetical protein